MSSTSEQTTTTSTASTTTAPATSTTPTTTPAPTKLKATALSFNPSAKPFIPTSSVAPVPITSTTPPTTSATPPNVASTTAPTTGTTAPKLNANVQPFKMKPPTKEFVPSGAFNAAAAPYVPVQPYGVPPMQGMPRMNGQPQFPIVPMIGPNGMPFVPQGYMGYPPPQFGYGPQGGFIPPYAMPPNMMGGVMLPPPQPQMLPNQIPPQYQQQMMQQQQVNGLPHGMQPPPPHQQQPPHQPQHHQQQPPPPQAQQPGPQQTQQQPPQPTNVQAPPSATPPTTTQPPATQTNTKPQTAASVLAAATANQAAVPAKKEATPPPATTKPAVAATPAKPAEPVKPSFAALAASSAAKDKLEAEHSGASTAQSFGVKPVAAVYKPKPASERKRELKKPEDEEQDLKEARQRANSKTEEESPPATTTTAAPAKPAAVVVPTTTSATPTAATTSAAPASSPNSRKQTTADAESSLASAISNTDTRQYSRDFLLKFQEMNVGEPANLLSSIELILKGKDDGGAERPGQYTRPGSIRMGQQQGQASSRIGSNRPTPAVPNSGAGQQRAQFNQPGRPGQPNSNNRNAQGGSSNQNRRPRVDQPMDIEIIPLAQSENRYKPLKDLPPDVELLRSLNAILNKLTPEKFDTLIDNVLKLKIETAALLRDVVTAVFEKALAEPNYSPVYAEFCVKLSARLPSFPADESDTQNTHNFKRLVLNQCQQEFENQDASTTAEASTTSEMTPEEKEEQAAKQKRRTLGTIRFIGELYVRGMLAGSIMKSCIVRLLGDVENAHEEDIEALAKLLETVGKLLDNKAQPKNHEFMNSVFEELEKLAQPPSAADRTKTEAGRPVLSSRIRFMIQDTLDLRRKDWVLRRKNEVNAKKISDVHKESAQPQDARATSTSSATRPTTLSVRPVGALRPKVDRYAVSSTPSPRGGAKPADDGWETAKGSSKRSQDVRGTGGMNRTNSGTGSSTSTANTPSHRSGPPTPQKSTFRGAGDKPEKKESEGKLNAFALLHGEEDEDESGGAAARAASGPTDEEELGGEDEPEPSADVDGDEVVQLSADEIAEKCKSFMKEFYSSEDFNEVKECIREIGGKSALNSTMVNEGLLFAIENKDKERNGFAKLISLLVSNDYLPVSAVEEGISQVLEASEDLSVDFPRLIENVATILASFIQDGIIDFSVVDRLSKVIPNSDDQVKFGTFTLSNVKKLKEAAGTDFVNFIKEAGIKFTDIGGSSLNPEQVKKLLSDKKLEMLVGIV